MYRRRSAPRYSAVRSVPEVLMSGHHEKIRAWRKLQAEETTKSRRPDLWAVYQQKAPKVGAPKS